MQLLLVRVAEKYVFDIEHLAGNVPLYRKLFLLVRENTRFYLAVPIGIKHARARNVSVSKQSLLQLT